ncbi:MAG TPA: MEDS domain-containing protein [Armatimonadota bacterium]|nr:MEDS domain-containing protein [Armatimonadota bacterium]
MNSNHLTETHGQPEHPAYLGQHIVSISDDPAAQSRLVTSAFCSALDDDGYCVFIADRTTPDAFHRSLAGTGCDVERAARDGRLTVLDAAETYKKSGTFEPERMLGLLVDGAASAKRMGARALVVSGELTWIGQPVAGSDRVLEYEYLINEVDELMECGIICVYDAATLPRAVAGDLAAVHPYTHSTGDVTPNEGFTANRDVAAAVRLADELQPRVDDISCDHLAVIISAHVDGELPAAQAGQVERHMATCGACAKAARGFSDIKAALGALQPPAAAPAGFIDALRLRLDAEA